MRRKPGRAVQENPTWLPEGYLQEIRCWGSRSAKSIRGQCTRRALCEIVPGDRVTIQVAPKGFGSENMSRVLCKKPAGRTGGRQKYV